MKVIGWVGFAGIFVLLCAVTGVAQPPAISANSLTVSSSIQTIPMGTGFPSGIALDASGNLYVSVGNDNVIRKITPSGVTTTVAGNGAAGFSGDGGAATSATLGGPVGIALDSAGNIYFADNPNNRIRKITTAGTITTMAGVGVAGFSGDGGPATLAQLSGPTGVAIDSSNNIYFSDTNNNRIRKVTPGGVITTVAGNGTAGFSGDGGAATSAALDAPMGIALDTAKNIYIAVYNSKRVRKVTTSGIISTVAGNGTSATALGDGGPATSAPLYGPAAVTVDAVGNLYIADSFVVGSPASNAQRIRKVRTDGTMRSVAGGGTIPGTLGDGGPALAVYLSNPQAIATDASGNLYIGDLGFIVNQSIRKVTFRVNPALQDLTADGKSDILWYNATTGQTVGWQMNGTSVSNYASLMTDLNWKVTATGDFNGDGKTDLVWYNASTGQTVLWLMNGLIATSTALVQTDPNWVVTNTPDLNGDGKSDLLWYNPATGQTVAWLMNGLAISSSALLLTDPTWKVTATADLDGDGKSDLLWYEPVSGGTAAWLMNGLTASSYTMFLVDLNWKVTATPDLNGDGRADLFWRNSATGQTAAWLMHGLQQLASTTFPTQLNVSLSATGDINGDGKTDLVWFNSTTGQTTLWLMNGLSTSSTTALLTDLNWQVTTTNDLNGDGRNDLQWYNAATAQTAVWLMNGTTISANAVLLTDPSWTTLQPGK